MGMYETVLTALFSGFALLLLISGARTYRRARSGEADSRKEALRYAALPLLLGTMLLLSALWILNRAGWLMLIVTLIAAATAGLSMGGGLGRFLQKR